MGCQRIEVKGIVQGVGFRPFVWQLATELGVRGRVWNDGSGVVIEACGRRCDLDTLVQRLQTESPPLAQIESIEVAIMSESSDLNGFEIIASHHSAMQTRVPTDAATCSACLAEFFDPDNRRYGYAFINCTHCGPRYSIIRAMPYDRAQTSMAIFPMCPACQAEYNSPADRRFHAQPNACPLCGPQLTFYTWRNNNWQGEVKRDAIALVAQLADALHEGAIFAMKGLGGFHLVCSAHHESAVQRLRQLKRRPHKPFALMAGFETLKNYVQITSGGKKWLKNPQNPIVLLSKQNAKKFNFEKKGETPLAESVAPGMHQLGFMLPGTALYHALIQAFGGVLVVTSCNLSGEPQFYRDEEVLAAFEGSIAGIVGHNREIVRRLEDSVVRICPVQGQHATVIRAARGMTPQHISWPEGARLQKISAAGADLKSAIALGTEQGVVLSQYLGDLEDFKAHGAYEQAWEDLHRLYQHQPGQVAADLHPGYFSTQFAQKQDMPVLRVQHHCAHGAAVMAEHGLNVQSDYLAVVLDGLGYGEDGQLWGGELLHLHAGCCTRLSHAQPFKLLGGEKAQRVPWRVLLALLWQADVPVNAVDCLQDKPLQLLRQAWEKGLNSPETSSVARWFDALAALTGLWTEAISYEGQAAMLTEAVLAEMTWSQVQPVEFALLEDGQLSSLPVWPALMRRQQAGETVENLCAAFYLGLAQGIVRWLERHGAVQMAGILFSGGVMQNLTLRYLIEHHWPVDFPPAYWSQNLPANDQGVAVGQLIHAVGKC